MNLHNAHPLEWTGDDISLAQSLYDRLEAAHREIVFPQPA